MEDFHLQGIKGRAKIKGSSPSKPILILGKSDKIYCIFPPRVLYLY